MEKNSLEELKAEIEVIKAENEGLRAEIEVVKTENEGLRAEIEAVKSENEVFKAEKERLKAEAEAEKKNFKAEKERLKAEAEAEKKNFKAEKEKLKAEAEAEKEKIIGEALESLEDSRAEKLRLKRELKALRLDYEIYKALEKSGARNIYVVAALIDKNALKYDDKKGVVGLEEQISSLKKNADTSFLFEDKRKSGGFVPYQPDLGYRENRSYKSFCEIYN